MSHSICIIHVATSRFPTQRLLAWHISTCKPYSPRGCRGLPRHTIMCNLLGYTWKSRSDSGEHWKGAPHSLEHWKGGAPFCIPPVFSQHSGNAVGDYGQVGRGKGVAPLIQDARFLLHYAVEWGKLQLPGCPCLGRRYKVIPGGAIVREGIGRE